MYLNLLLYVLHRAVAMAYAVMLDPAWATVYNSRLLSSNKCPPMFQKLSQRVSDVFRSFTGTDKITDAMLEKGASSLRQALREADVAEASCIPAAPAP